MVGSQSSDKNTLHFKDPEASRLLRQLAKERQLSLTDALKEAVKEALAKRKGKGVPLAERLKPFFERIDKLPRVSSDATSKEAFDELWEEPSGVEAANAVAGDNVKK